MAQRRHPELHDVLVFPPSDGEAERKLFRLVASRDHEGRVVYVTPAVELRRADKDRRRAESVARAAEPETNGVAPGAAFATLPIKPEPGGANGVTCYLLDADNFHSPNFWTVEEWNDGPAGIDYETPVHPNEFEVLLAGPHGKVFRVSIKDVQAWTPGEEEQDTRSGKSGARSTGYATIACIDLRHNSAIWHQLRSGCVAGRTTVTGDASESIPLVNVTALGGSKFECHHVTAGGDVPGEEGAV